MRKSLTGASILLCTLPSVAVSRGSMEAAAARLSNDYLGMWSSNSSAAMRQVSFIYGSRVRFYGRLQVAPICTPRRGASFSGGQSAGTPFDRGRFGLHVRGRARGAQFAECSTGARKARAAGFKPTAPRGSYRRSIFQAGGR